MPDDFIDYIELINAFFISNLTTSFTKHSYNFDG